MRHRKNFWRYGILIINYTLINCKSARAALLVAALLVAGALATLAAAAGEATPRGLELQREIQALAQRIEASRGERDAASAALERTEREIVELSASRARLAREMAAIEARIEQLDAANARAAERLPTLTAQLDQALTLRYRLARTARGSILFDAADPARIQRELSYFNHLLDAQTRRIDELSAEIDAMQSARDELAAQRQALARTRAAHDEQAAALATRRAERAAQVEQLATRLARDNTLIAEKRSEAAELERLLDGLEQLRRDPPPPSPTVEAPAETAPPADERPASPAPLRLDGLTAHRGVLSLPAVGEVVTRFRQPDALSGIPSSGIVIAAQESADVRSIFDGQVVYSGWFRGYGLLLVMDHGDGFMSLYGNNSELLVPIGAQVAANTPVARAGATGGRARAGVYFEIRRRGDALDPLAWCRPRRS